MGIDKYDAEYFKYVYTQISMTKSGYDVVLTT